MGQKGPQLGIGRHEWVISEDLLHQFHEWERLHGFMREERDATEGEGGIFVSKDGWTKAANRVAKCQIA